MIGSRLLFSGYGRGFKSRPLHAGFLGQDTLLVHDEAHLEPAFQKLIEAITKEQERCKDFMKLRIMEMTATARSDGDSELPLFTDRDRKHPEARKRIEAKKGIILHPINDEKEIAKEIANCALNHRGSNQAILIYARSVENVFKIVEQLNKEGLHDQVQTLTGTLRGLERDALAINDPVFARFMPIAEDKQEKGEPRTGTVYLVCTSAGEVGVNISGDHLVYDLTPFESMAQRFGRVNRFGKSDSQIDIIHANFQNIATSKATNSESIEAEPGNKNAEDTKKKSKNKAKEDSPFNQACIRTLSLLQKLSRRDDQRYDASPAALNSLPVAERKEAFTPPPVILPTSDILFDAWALTSVRKDLPGRPAVADWLHGIADWESPVTHIAWRDEVALLTNDLIEKYKPEELIEDYPIKPHEMLQDRTDRVFGNLEKIAKRCPKLNSWIMESDGSIRVLSLHQLVDESKQKKPVDYLSNRTVLLPPGAGGLDNKGFLDGNAEFAEIRRANYDVSDRWTDPANATLRCRIWDVDEPPNDMRLIRTIDIDPEAEDEGAEEISARRYWYWYVRPRSADDDGSKSARQRQTLENHSQLAEVFAGKIVAKLRLDQTEASAIVLAARWHDSGKNRKIWQRSIGNFEYPQEVLAKSGERMRPVDLGNFRHEFGSLIDVVNLSEFQELEPEMQELVLHLIAAHHGRARPLFAPVEAFDHNYTDIESNKIACEVPRRFGRLQRKYGRWGLAYLESLVRAADALASQSNDTGKTAKSSGITATEAQ